MSAEMESGRLIALEEALKWRNSLCKKPANESRSDDFEDEPLAERQVRTLQTGGSVCELDMLERAEIIQQLGARDRLPPCNGTRCSLEELRIYESLYLRQEMLERQKIIHQLKDYDRLPECDGTRCSLDELRHYESLYLHAQAASSANKHVLNVPQSFADLLSAAAASLKLPYEFQYSPASSCSASTSSTLSRAASTDQSSDGVDSSETLIKSLRAECKFLAARRDFYAARCAKV